jgi:hypothetical protein
MPLWTKLSGIIMCAELLVERTLTVAHFILFYLLA